MKTTIIIVFATMLAITLCGQKIKYKDLYQLLQAKQYENAEPFLRIYIKQNENDANACLFMGIVFEDKLLRTGNASLIINYVDSALLFYNKALEKLTTSQINENKEYYEMYTRRNPKNGKFEILLEDVQHDINRKIEKIKIKQNSLRPANNAELKIEPAISSTISREEDKPKTTESLQPNYVKPTAQQQKYALIIGVKSYQYVQPLQNSLNDARDMAATLKQKGFTVVELYDPATKRVMQDGILKYFKLLQAQPNAAGLVFYSGHGMQVKGVNYLIPTQADPQIEADLDDQCVNMDYVMRAIEQAGNGLNIFVLDACRNNPFRSFSRSGEKGLSMVETPKGSYIVYATKPGSVASDGTGRNGLFTSKLLQYINTEGLNIEQVFKRTAHDVATASADAQRPWIASDYTGDFFFTPGSGSTITTQPISKPIAKTETVHNATITTTLDYGYGTADAPTVIVGTQEWLGKNLNVDHFANGDIIPEAKTDEEWVLAGQRMNPVWCYYNNDPTNGRTYGRLYNWYAVNDPRGLAPSGWHVPSDSEWAVLIRHLVGNSTEVNKPLVSDSQTHFTTEGVGTLLKSNNGWNGNNNSGVACLPGGLRWASGFNYLGQGGYWWSSSKITAEEYALMIVYNSGLALYDNYDAWAYNMSFNFDFDEVHKENYPQSCGFSVRCLRD